MKKRSKLLYALALTLCLSIFFASSALLAVQARGNVETGREASLKLTYGYAGKTFEVLVDGVTNEEYNLSSRTKSGRLVHLKGDEALVGSFVNVKITSSTTWALFGELED